MSDVTTMLDRLKRQGVLVRSLGDRLRLQGPAGVLTPETVEQLRHHKSELLAILRSDRAAARWKPLVPAGWTPSAWHGRLTYMAKVCLRADRAQELQEWARAVEDKHGLTAETGQ